MSRFAHTSDKLAPRPAAGVEVVTLGEAALIRVSGLIDEQFPGLPKLGDEIKTAVIHVAAMTRMTSFGVRQWLRAMDGVPKAVTDLYLLGCPTFFVDQLNMVLSFGGAAQILTVVAPYTCPACGVESDETIDVLAERGALVKGGVPDKACARCAGKLELDETPESYFAFAAKYGATQLASAAAQLLAAHALYTAVDAVADKPPRIIKLVHGAVTYFRIIGTIGHTFRARPLIAGAEGEVVIDLAELDRFDPLGLPEWRRLLKTLAGQVPAVTLVDVTGSLLAQAGDSFGLARNIFVASVLLPYRCVECGRRTPHSQSLASGLLPAHALHANHVCPVCGGTTRNELPVASLSALQKASTQVPEASAKLIEQRNELLSRALTDANVQQAGEAAIASDDEHILGKYQIVRRLSAGGMAEVFLAKQVGIGGFEKPVALKRIQRQLLETRRLAIDMFLNEAKIAGRLTHPNIVQVLDVGEVGGALYLAMEYVHGKDLRDVLKQLRTTRTRMPLGDACYVVRDIAQALHHAYWSTDLDGKQLSVVHRDVSPHNIILGFDGSVKLLDFGVAMSSVTEQADTMIVGKWLYMSPEHTHNQAIDHRSDLFSLGVILYLLCTGKMPFAARSPTDIVDKIRAGHHKPVQHHVPSIPDTLAVLIARMLAPDPDDRPQTGREVVNALTEIARAYGIESSAGNIANFVATTFAGEDSAKIEVTPVDGDDREPAAGDGDGVPRPRRSTLDDRSSSLQASALSGSVASAGPGSPALDPVAGHSVSLPIGPAGVLSSGVPIATATPFPVSGPLSPIDISVSIKPRGQPASTPPSFVARVPDGPPDALPRPANEWSMRRFVIIAIAVAVALAGYLVIR
jgi:serine/threonine protein kinase